MMPIDVYRSIAEGHGFLGISQDNSRIYMWKPVWLEQHVNSGAALINIVLDSDRLMMNDATGTRHLIEYCDPRSIDIFEGLIGGNNASIE
jgi:hypothetical protein